MTTPHSSDRIDIYYDPNWQSLQPVATEYAGYLAGTYEQHRLDNINGWEIHEANMNAKVTQGINRIAEVTGKSVDQLSLLIVGPGMKPAGREFLKSTMDLLRQAKKIVVGDICPQVTEHAAANLVENGVPRDRILQAQLDVTNGRSIAYDIKIDNALDGVETLEQLLKAIETLNAVSIDSLIEPSQPMMPPWKIAGGRGEQQQRSVRSGHNVFTHKGELVRLDGIFYQMVMAGIGAAAEGKIWNRLYACLKREGDVAETPEQKRELSLLATRVRIALHQLIANFHTHSAVLTFRDAYNNAIASSIQPPVQISINDTDTELMHTPDHPLQGGTLKRIRMDEVVQTLSKVDDNEPHLNVTMEQVGPWADEVHDSLRSPHIPGHQHPNVKSTTIIPEHLQL